MVMADPWTSQSSVSLGGPRDRVTLVEGSAFLICSAGGEVAPEFAEGLFFRDTRFLSAPYAAPFGGRGRPRPGRADSDLMVERRRYVGRGMREDLFVRNFGE